VKAPSPDELVPPRYKGASAASAHPLPRQWWRLFNDAQLNELVETVLRDNPYTQVALLRIAAARAQAEVANADRQPQMNGSAGFSNGRTSAHTPLGKALGFHSISGNKHSVGVEASWQIDAWGRVARAMDAARAGVESEMAFGRLVEQTLSWETAVTYWQYRLAESEFEGLSQIHRRRQEAVGVLAGRFEAGLASEIDLARARLELNHAEADVEDARKRMSEAEHELATLTVKPVAGFSVPRDGPYRLPEVPLIEAGLPASILRQRPDLAQSAKNIRGLLAHKEIADSAFYPSISLTGNFGFASMGLRHLTSPDSRQYSIGPLAITLPILDAGRIRASQQIAEARYLEAVNLHKVQLLIALREVDDALTGVQAYRAQVGPLQAAVESARQVSRMAVARYDKGAVNYLDVANAARDALAAELKARRHRVKGLLAATQLVHALGGGWQDDAAASAPAAASTN
jgi:multidrug efflux system outer membrane protein